MSSDNVQQELGDGASEIFYEAIQRTWTENQVLSYGDHFRSPKMRQIGDKKIGMCCDGIGTKVNVAESMASFNTLGSDLVAMVADDATAMGCKPLMMTTTLDVGTQRHLFPWEMIHALADGLAIAAQYADVPVVGGEFAQMGEKIQGEGDLPIIWNAALTWECVKDSPITGANINPGNKIVAIEEPSCRSNGYTLLTKILKRNMGNDWWNEKFADEGVVWGTKALEPSRIYTPAIQPLLPLINEGGYLDITGMIHVTGGGLSGRLKSYLGRYEYGAIIDNPYPPGALFRYIMDRGWVDLRTGYENWCMGNGFLIITSNPGGVIEALKEECVESMVIGTVMGGPGVTITPPISLSWS